MRRALRLLVTWLLLLALPVQGIAASTMLLCSDGHHGLSPAVSVGAHDHAAHAHMTAAEPPNDTSSASPHHAKPVAGKCNACASCCAAAWLPTAVISIPAALPGQAPDAFAPTARAGFFTDGPDRPPRSFLA